MQLLLWRTRFSVSRGKFDGSGESEYIQSVPENTIGGDKWIKRECLVLEVAKRYGLILNKKWSAIESCSRCRHSRSQASTLQRNYNTSIAFPSPLGRK